APRARRAGGICAARRGPRAWPLHCRYAPRLRSARPRQRLMRWKARPHPLRGLMPPQRRRRRFSSLGSRAPRAQKTQRSPTSIRAKSSYPLYAGAGRFREKRVLVPITGGLRHAQAAAAHHRNAIADAEEFGKITRNDKYRFSAQGKLIDEGVDL